MKKLRFRLEDKARMFVNYLDYYLFKLTHFPKRLPEINKIIVIELKYMGDIIVTTPVYSAIKKKFPSAKIDVAVPNGMEDVLYGNKKISKLLKQKAKYRIGCTRVGVLEPKGYYLNRKTRPSKWQHKVFDNLDVLKTIGIEVTDPKLELYINPEAKKSIQNKLTREGVKNKDKMLIIHAPPQHKTHQWLPERFAELANILSKDYKIIFTGAKKDVPIVNNILSKMHNKAINFAF